ncbi:glycoside hydrolase superfamily [Polychytrium aggregatum]|uniref:glycoside hydrolase superfamily n=1 Tax=Polychytrium aggregatum TaxID=110093 RepID=UPI0022FDCDA3|nr:glycoside hydrolase superfamily [Polychytrium aggregatum]KAI9208485.1 glycoside hydrolase superfamily [Polychytrium aggregatum]
MVKLSVSLLAASLCALVQAGAPLEPQDGRLFLSAWLDTSNGPYGSDSPVSFNSRLGVNAGAFHDAQNMPVTVDPFGTRQTGNLTSIELTKTDAIFYLTVYPNFSTMTNADILDLAYQAGNITTLSNRRLLIRFGPEMNGNWMQYGQQPTLYRQQWIQVYNAVKAKAPSAAFMWAPNLSAGYPYTIVANLSAADLKLMDTNGDGVVNSSDDPYGPYYPGDEYVDWVGMSIYWKGPASTWPFETNMLCVGNYLIQILNGGGTEGGNPSYPFYNTYASGKNKPMAISETAAAIHLIGNGVPLSPGPGQLAVQQSYWAEYMTNSTFLDLFPKIKLLNLFEFKKNETETSGTQQVTVLRDFRQTINTTVLSAFKSDLSKVSSRYIWANSSSTTTPPSSTGSSGSSGSAYVSIAVVALAMALSLGALI